LIKIKKRYMDEWLPDRSGNRSVAEVVTNRGQKMISVIQSTASKFSYYKNFTVNS
jgi:hypothetical protein